MTPTIRIPVSEEDARAIATIEHERWTSMNGPRCVTRAEWIKNRFGEIMKNGADQCEIDLLKRGEK